ncbi:uncharacterized protein DMENIID0001_007100 [Sergentomyia squamirostris]
MSSVKDMTSWRTANSSKRKGDSPESHRGYKQRKILDYWLGSAGPSVTTKNQFDPLADRNEDNDNILAEKSPSSENQTESTESTKTNEPKPPPIFVHGVEEIKPLLDLLEDLIPGSYTLKTLHNNQVKIQVGSSDNYRVVYKELLDKKTELHSYQFKKDKTFRIVLKNIHHSTDLADIKTEFLKHGHTVKHITNMKHHTTKSPLPMFFVDLLPNSNNKEVYNIKLFLHSVVEIQPPKLKREIVQCTNCQRFGHTKSFCNRQPRCVKCDSYHSTKECERKTKDHNVKCTNCGENHPANYRGCRVHKELQQKLYPKLRQKEMARAGTGVPQAQPVSLTRPGLSYADQLTGRVNPINEWSDSIPDNRQTVDRQNPQNDFNELKNMLKMLLEQVGNMLSLITKLVTKDSK